MSLLVESKAYRPFRYPWAFDYWKRQQQIHWLPDESPLGDDVKDYKKNLEDHEKNNITQIFRFFTQSDIEIQNCYHKHYMRVFKPTEVQMMLTAFANMETVHIAAYSHLLDTLSLPEVEYSAFLKYKEMKDKFDWLHSFNPDGDPMNVAKSMAAFSGATEGMSLFASFAMLMNYPRHNLMRGMGDIISWSIRDESLHCEGISHLYKVYKAEQRKHIDAVKLTKDIREVFEQAVANEDAFVDLAFAMGPCRNMTAEDTKIYIRSIADLRLSQLGEKRMYKIKHSVVQDWMAEVLNAPEHGNFFETRVTEYSKGATTGEWDESAYDF
jgi:ribonucleoside-diphosphate reductase beta chain